MADDDRLHHPACQGGAACRCVFLSRPFPAVADDALTPPFVVHGIDRYTQDHLCGSPAGLGTDALAPTMPITCPLCRGARPERREGDCWLCTHPVWGPLCSACGCLAHYPPHPEVASGDRRG